MARKGPGTKGRYVWVTQGSEAQNLLRNIEAAKAAWQQHPGLDVRKTILEGIRRREFALMRLGVEVVVWEPLEEPMMATTLGKAKLRVIDPIEAELWLDWKCPI